MEGNQSGGPARQPPESGSVIAASVAGRIALVTGGTRGIGRAVAVAFASAGATVVAIGRSASGEAGRELSGDERTGIESLRCDVNDDAQIESLRSIIDRRHGRLDVLVHCAGRHDVGPVDRTDADQLDLLYRTNFRAPYQLTRAFLPMLQNARGDLVFVNSSASLRQPAGVTPYASTKLALKALADGLRQEINSLGVRVLSVYPGRTATPMQERQHRLEGKTYRPDRLLQPEDVASVILHAVAMPRTAEVMDVSIRPFLKP